MSSDAGTPSVVKKRKRKRSKKNGEDYSASAPIGHVGKADQDEHLSDESFSNKKRQTNKKVIFREEPEHDKVVKESIKEEKPAFIKASPESKVVMDESTSKATVAPEMRASKEPSGLPAKNKKKAKKVVKYFDKEDVDNSDFEDDQVGDEKLSYGQLKERAASLLNVREKLPIHQHQEEIINYIQSNQVTVIIGETGSGKSTQIPQYLMPLNSKQIAVTQPRRVAASSLATRVSEEYGCRLGDEVGYQVRFSNFTSHRTKLKYLTDGMLLREIMLDKKLTKYTTIIIDEAHERTILTDLIMGFLKELLVSGKRKDLKLVIMSATLNAELFSKFFDHAPVLFVEGKMYPVSKHYLQENVEGEEIVDTMVRTIVQVNMSEQEGDILCFLPGQEEIDNCVSILSQIAPHLPKEAPHIVALPLYAALSPHQQQKIFQKLKGGRKRKVILATNIAETSITVSGVKYVIDSGLRKIKVWRHSLGLSTLLTTPISQASAKQRAGRAGRESVGKVFRLYSEKLFLTKLPKQQESEIMRNDIILPILALKKLGVDDLLNWSWLEHPGKEAILSALSTLYSLGALNDSGKITAIGYKMATLPLPPQLSVVLITAFEKGVLNDVIDIAACLSVDNLVLNVFTGGDTESRDEVNFKRRQYCPMGNKSGDLIALKEYFNYFMELSRSRDSMDEVKDWCKEMHFSYKGFKNVLKVRAQLKDYMLSTIRQDDSLNEREKEKQLRSLRSQLDTTAKTNGDNSDDEDFGLVEGMDIPNILKSFLKGYVTNSAIGMPDRSYRTVTTGQLISIHPSSNLFGKVNLDAVMYMEYVYTTKGYGRNCSVIELGWLQETSPQMLGAAKVHIEE
ncbi:probable ATP-dependent RNA helicase Dhr2p [[Candida] railenensis]|uniref:RNA helicase n=1 Tax=[Candida] railenensis TaxID=45579 RepID=A0A9P0QSW8_9ASCO|nr:probable ATP-dependent RNA helicase Dhr2p [[Candida] railenensis]